MGFDMMSYRNEPLVELLYGEKITKENKVCLLLSYQNQHRIQNAAVAQVGGSVWTTAYSVLVGKK